MAFYKRGGAGHLLAALILILTGLMVGFLSGCTFEHVCKDNALSRATGCDDGSGNTVIIPSPSGGGNNG